VRAAFSGAVAQSFHRGGDDVAVRVSYPAERRVSIRDLEHLTIVLPAAASGGVRAPLSRVARIDRQRGWAELTHLDRLRSVAVTADVDERAATVGQVVAALRPFLTEELPGRFAGVSVRLEGQRATQRETFAGLQVGGLVGLLIIVAVLVLVTDSWTMPLFVMSVIPFGVVGVVFGHLLMGYKMTMLGTMAAIGLAGVIINDSILVVEFYARARRETGSAVEALVVAVTRRFRPIVITSATTIAGLLPMLLETSIQAQFLIPMAITLAFGLLTGTLGTLIVLPCALKIADDVGSGRTQRSGRETG
jgi:multidrug efflux pump subunit AcrB